jgi:hypothetical protein
MLKQFFSMPKDSPTKPEQLLSNPTFLMVANISSIFGLVLTMALWKVEIKPEHVAIRDGMVGIFMIVLAVSMTATAAFLSFSLNRLRKIRKESRVGHLKGFHRIMDKVRDLCWRSELTGAELSLKSPTAFLQALCTTILTETRSLIIENLRSREIDIGEDVTLTLKMIFPADEARKMLKNTPRAQQSILKDQGAKAGPDRLVTMARDSQTTSSLGNERELLECLYSVMANTAFVRIMKHDDNVYVQNDLGRLGNDYSNENDKWQLFYNSTIVVPVRFKPDSTTFSTIFGLFCVDSLNPSKYELYNRQETFEIVGHAADLIATLLYGFEKIRQEAERQKKALESKVQPGQLLLQQ